MVRYAVFPRLPIPVNLDTCKLLTLVYIGSNNSQVNGRVAAEYH